MTNSLEPYLKPMVTPGAGRRDGQRQGALRNARAPACAEGELGTPSKKHVSLVCRAFSNASICWLPDLGIILEIIAFVMEINICPGNQLSY